VKIPVYFVVILYFLPFRLFYLQNLLSPSCNGFACLLQHAVVEFDRNFILYIYYVSFTMYVFRNFLIRENICEEVEHIFSSVPIE
jgi:hypothetical protein